MWPLPLSGLVLSFHCPNILPLVRQILLFARFLVTLTDFKKILVKMVIVLVVLVELLVLVVVLILVV